MEEADFFSDEDLNLPDNTILELEQNAITSTQKPQRAPSQQQHVHRLQRPKLAHNASGHNRPRSTNNNIPWRPPRRVTQAPRVSQPPEPPSQPFAYEEEAVVNLEDDDKPVDWSQSQALAQKPVSNTTFSSRRKAPLDAETAAAFAAADAEMTNLPQRKFPVPEESSEDRLVLEARIAALESEAARARQAESEARKALEAKNGEITIVRANADKAQREHERRLQSMQRNHAEEASKHKLELEAGRKEREKMQTDNRFLQHDLAQEAERVKRLNGPGKARTAGERDTPKKSRRAGIGDGFDDDEIHSYSPSRSRDRPKDSTPKAGAKRKRSAQDSPIAPLSFAKSSPLAREDRHDSMQQLPVAPVTPLHPPSTHTGDSIRYMQRLLEYRPLDQSLRTLELLSTCSLPSSKHQVFSSTLMNGLSMARAADTSLAIQTMHVVAKLWDACLEQHHYTPVPVLVDLMQFAMHQDLPSRTNVLLEHVVPLCLKSLEIITMPVVRAHLRAPYSSTTVNTTEHAVTQLDPDQITTLLYELCQCSALSAERISTFWHFMDFTNSMLLLHKALSLDRVMTGLKILHTSVLNDSFGPIHEDSPNQEQQERSIVYRLTYALFDIPTVPINEDPYDDIEILQFRMMVLEVLTRLCAVEHGSRLLAVHTHFVGHLVRFLDEQIRKLYICSPTPRLDPDTLDAHTLVVKTINMAMRILHYLLTAHGDLIDLSEKFAVVTGGYHKFLIGMTRLAFVEQPSIYEQGIEESVIDAAHSILDAFLTPEDGEAVAQALETPQASKGTSRGEIGQNAAVNDVDDDEMMDTDES